MIGYYEMQDFTVEIEKESIDKKMIIFYDLKGKEVTREIYLEGANSNITFNENNDLMFVRKYGEIEIPEK